MQTVIGIIIAILIFGLLVLIHEFGHFIFAKKFGVTVNEFSIGMGPSLLWYDSKKTGIRYKLAMFPLGGYVAMAGEDDESDDPNSFDKKPAWQRFIITFAGAFVNIVFGFIVMIIVSSLVNIGTTKIHSFQEGSTSNEALMAGDEILEVEGRRVKIADELAYEIMRHGNEPVDILVLRDGVEVLLPDVSFPKSEESGQVFGTVDFVIYGIKDKGIGDVLSYSFSKSWLMLRMCWESIIDLITGRYTLAAVSGPVGISGAIGDAAASGIIPLLNIVVIISINLGFMNLLPIPALDGGRLLTVLIEMITRKRIPKKIEGLINGVGLMLLLLLSFVIMIKDVVGLII